VTTGPWNPAAASRPGRNRLRASDNDRERVVDILKTAFVQGRLTSEELGERAGQAFMARTYADLAAITADIPDVPALLPPLPAPARTVSSRSKKVAAWVALGLVLAPAITGAFLTFYGGFVILFVLAFIGATVTAQP
jgi:hypothetical protein